MHYEKIKTQILKAAWVYQKTTAYIFKKTGYIWVSIALIAVAVMELAAKGASLFMVVSLYSIVLIPILYETDFGSMMISGLIRTGIWLAIWIAMAFLSRTSPLAAKISLWPISPA